MDLYLTPSPEGTQARNYDTITIEQGIKLEALPDFWRNRLYEVIPCIIHVYRIAQDEVSGYILT